MKEFAGVYRGFSPVAALAARVGEAEITVTETEVRFRVATGSAIREEWLPLTDLVPMAYEEIKKEYRTVNHFVLRTTGFKNPGGWPRFMFLADPRKEEIALLLRLDEATEKLGISFLFNEKQVNRGVLKRFIFGFETEAAQYGSVPSLATEGKANARPMNFIVRFCRAAWYMFSSVWH